MMKKQNDCRPQQCDGAKQPEKKPYARPELSKHGQVEDLTQQIQTGPSGPIRE